MDNDVSSANAANSRHNRYMVIGKKQRYIEVLQCSGEDMSMVLTGGLGSPTTPTKSAGLVTPGMLQLPPPNVQPPAAAAALPPPPPTDPLQAAALNSIVYQNMLLSGLLSPSPAAAQVSPGWDLVMPPQSPYLMLPGGGSGVPRLIAPSLPLNANPSLFLPPPGPNPLSVQAAGLPRPPLSVFPVSHPPPPLQTASVKRTHDQAFHAGGDAVPPKRNPVLYPPTAVSSAAAGLLPSPSLPLPYSQL